MKPEITLITLDCMCCPVAFFTANLARKIRARILLNITGLDNENNAQVSHA
jgi:hypothetical protein